MRHTHICLKLDGVIQSALDEVGSSEGVFHDGDTSSLEIAFGDTDSFILHTELCQKTGLNISLEKAGFNVNISHKRTTFKERVTHTVDSY
jgi:hypothetical protein